MAAHPEADDQDLTDVRLSKRQILGAAEVGWQRVKCVRERLWKRGVKGRPYYLAMDGEQTQQAPGKSH